MCGSRLAFASPGVSGERRGGCLSVCGSQATPGEVAAPLRMEQSVELASGPSQVVHSRREPPRDFEPRGCADCTRWGSRRRRPGGPIGRTSASVTRRSPPTRRGCSPARSKRWLRLWGEKGAAREGANRSTAADPMTSHSRTGPSRGVRRSRRLAAGRGQSLRQSGRYVARSWAGPLRGP
jgi:hypothetical protein